jgi:enoyl-CoA hydratase/carnithine racemase
MQKFAAARHADEDRILLREDGESIAMLVLNRPQARNALSEAMIEELSAAFKAIAADNAVRAVVIAANGPVFSAGHDLKEMTAHRNDADRGREYFRDLFARCSAMTESIALMPQPVIAAIQGVATAAGCQLVASCDLAVASENAKFSLPGVDIGLFCSAPMVPVSRKIAPNHALELLLTGEPISAQRANEIGLVNRVVPVGKEREEALMLARTVATKSAYVQRIGKDAFYRQLELSLAEAYRYGSSVMAENMLAHDAAEGINAFLEKRAPKWEDR